MLLCFGCGSLGGTERCLSSTSPVASVEPMPACMRGEGGGGMGLSVRGGAGLSVRGGDEREGGRERREGGEERDEWRVGRKER